MRNDKSIIKERFTLKKFPMVSLEFFSDINNKQKEDSLYQKIGLKFEEETSRMLHLELG